MEFVRLAGMELRFARFSGDHSGSCGNAFVQSLFFGCFGLEVVPVCLWLRVFEFQIVHHAADFLVVVRPPDSQRSSRAPGFSYTLATPLFFYTNSSLG